MWRRSCQGSRGVEGGTVAGWGVGRAGGAGGGAGAVEAGGAAGTLGETSRASSSRSSAC